MEFDTGASQAMDIVKEGEAEQAIEGHLSDSGPSEPVSCAH